MAQADFEGRLAALEQLEARVKKLEDKFDPPGGPGLSQQVAAAMQGLEELREDIVRRTDDLDERVQKKIDEAYRILAKIRAQLPGQSASGGY